MQIIERLKAISDADFAAFQRRLLPTVPPESVIGVRTPDLRKLAKEMIRSGEAETFLSRLPHAFFDENQLHAFLLAEEKDFKICLNKVNLFLPYIDNWATCDQLSPKVFKKHPAELMEYIQTWIQSDHTYTIRFGIGMLMQHFLDDRFDIRYPEMVTKIHSDEYYINMMIAWYFATALAKQYDQILPFIKKQKLDNWTHNKTIQKAIESYRITDAQKTYLKTLKV